MTAPQINPYDRPRENPYNRPINPYDPQVVHPPIEQSAWTQQLWSGIKQVGRDIGEAFSTYLGEMISIPGPEGLVPASPLQALVKKAQAGDMEAMQKVQSIGRGNALIASTAAAAMTSGAAGAITAKLGIGGMGPLTLSATRQVVAAKAASFVATEALGGAAYGATRPLEENEERDDAIAKETLINLGFGAGLVGVFKVAGLGARQISKLTKSTLDKFAALNPREQVQVASEVRGRMGELLAKVKNADAISPEESAELAGQVFEHHMTQPRGLVSTPSVTPTLSPMFNEPGVVKVDPSRIAVPRAELPGATPDAFTLQNRLDPTLNPDIISAVVNDQMLHPPVSLSSPEITGLQAPREITFPDVKQPSGALEQTQRVPLHTRDAWNPPPSGFVGNSMDRTAAEIAADLDPRVLTWGEPPASGFEATSVGAPAVGSPNKLHLLALADDAVDEALSRVEPTSLLSPKMQAKLQAVREVPNVELAPAREIDFSRNPQVGSALDDMFAKQAAENTPGVKLGDDPQFKALVRSAFVDNNEQAFIELMTPVAKEAAEAQSARVGRALSKGRPGRVQYLDPPPSVLSTPMPSELSSVTSEIAQHLPPKMQVIAHNWHKIAKEMEQVGKEQIVKKAGNAIPDVQKGIILGSGPIPAGIARATLARMLIGTSGVIELQAARDQQEKGNLSTAAFLGMLGLGSVIGAGYPWLRPITEKMGGEVVKTFDTYGALRKYPEAQTLAKGAHNIVTQFQSWGSLLNNNLTRIFKTPEKLRAASLALEGDESALALLTTSEREEVLAMRGLHDFTGAAMVDTGLLEHARDNYVRHLYPKEFAERFLVERPSSGMHLGPGGFAKSRQFVTQTEAIAFARRNGLPEPIVNLAKQMRYHFEEMGAAIGKQNLFANLRRTGLVQPMNADLHIPLPEGHVRAKVLGFGDVQGHADVIQALRIFAESRHINDPTVQAASDLAGFIMEKINLVNFDYAANIARAGLAVSMNPAAFQRAQHAINNFEPKAVEWASRGLKMKGMADIERESSKISEAFDAAWKKIGQVPVLGPAYQKWENFSLNKMVQGVTYFVAETEEMRYIRRNRLLGKTVDPNSAEYKAQMQRIADFANKVPGQMQELFQSKSWSTMLRTIILFAPTWMRTRVSLTVNAAKEAADIAAGELNPTQAIYMPFWIKKTAYTMGVTWAVDKILAKVQGREGGGPQFNEKTYKHYVRSGIHDKNGRELGVDFLGWWQDDLKLMNDPVLYFKDRLAPLMRTYNQTVSGLDNFGRPMTGAEKFENAARGVLGPIYPALEMSKRVGTALVKDGTITNEQYLRGITESIAMGNVASLPTSADVISGRLAQKYLERFNIPANSDNVYQLSRMIRSASRNRRSLTDEGVGFWIAYKQREMGNNPLLPLWMGSSKLLQQLGLPIK